MPVFEPEVRAFLQQPWIGRLATISADGWPHVIPLWYLLDGDDIVITSIRKSGKVANLLRDNRAALNVGGEPAHGPAYLIRGRAAIIADPDHAWLRTITLHYESPEEAAADLAAWTVDEYVLIRLTVERVTRVF